VELNGALATRGDMETRLRDSQQALTRRVDALHTSTASEASATKQELEELSQALQRLDQSLKTWRAEVAKEIRTAASAREAVELSREQGAAGLEGLRRETSQHWVETEGRFERLQVELATAAATRETFEFRVRESQEETRKLVDLWQGNFRDELGSLQRRLTSESEACNASLREEIASVQRRLGAELRAEARALLKTEQNALAALDEQLWLTDQRLGQRIDELVQAAGRGGERLVAAVTSVATDLPRRLPSEPRGVRVSMPLTAPVTPVATPADSNQSPIREPLEVVAPPTLTVVSRGPSPIPRLSDAQQLERLRNARKRTPSLAAATTVTAPALEPVALDNDSLEPICSPGTSTALPSPGCTNGSMAAPMARKINVLQTAHDAAEVLDEIGKGA